MNLNELTIKKALDGLLKKEFSSVELTKACVDRINSVEGKINAFVTTQEEEALEQAKRADEKIKSGADIPLLGVPFVIKDNFCTKGVRTTASSKVLDNFIPPYDATVVSKLKSAGIVILGKTNMDAWAHGSSTETSDYGATKNPWDLNRLPGGSSGGSAAAIAADVTVGSIGSETAGSIRQPASWCGVVGLKPTYGRVSRYGVIAMASSLDCPGPIAKTVEDSALVLNVLAGADKYDATTSPKDIGGYTKDLNKNITGLKIGVSKKYLEMVEDSDMRRKIEEAISHLEKLGATVKYMELFDPKYSIAVYTILQRAEVSSNLARYDGIRFGTDRTFFGAEAKRRIMLGTYALSAGYYDAYYSKAQKVRTVIVENFNRAFQEVDVIVGPTTPSTALPLGASESSLMFGEMMDVLIEPSTIAGLPAINIPCGFDRTGLPIGLQIMGPHFSEKLILNVAYQYEQTTKWHMEKPKL